MENYLNNPKEVETLPNPDVLPDTEETEVLPTPEEDSPWDVPAPKVKPTPKG